jgi:hypothetical protein
MLNLYSVPERNVHVAVLTEINNKTASMTVKPGSGNTWNAEITYKICNFSVTASADASGSETYPNAAINKTGLDEESEDPIDPHRCTSFTQMFLYCHAALPKLRTLRNKSRQTRDEGAHQAFQAINPVERILVASVGPPRIRARSPNFMLLSSSMLWCDGLKRGTKLRPRSHPAAAVSIR